MDGLLSFAGKPFAALMWIVGAASVHKSWDTGSVLLIVGAIIYALALWRSKSTSVLRQENADISARNITLEADLVRVNALNTDLLKRPDLESQEALLKKLIESLEKHDEHMAEIAAETVKLLKEIRVAVVPRGGR